ncbi:type I restriction endonuclease subunit S [Mycoplasmopsis pullorum]|uniref:restriction endonuclease subunit S n=1 Tax=Mycoplasmopsis pullorum TaxID=48003 RepID=UPI00111B5202|nr:restriction endonuclease subunit S [Mycoplasmopsis pullorum]TNK81968.1 type I restriction endonuclease subunit S [Mycoplasmopsis pullorum]TNK83385.1 type I restriction endonuclease subunit S [Mycoplasmopsis pullorum]TNK85038.1 type I restriction endonuclease subunit S [Mycoplasmopsis pullorum]TNK85282.1 type I restriction endonuclease subunit S [Mycoplasmopsis pullorum]TNK86175.1 type I restriction endonuclease subunit S [Mycoplasmopsis pullorum]
MALKKIKIGKLIAISEDKNTDNKYSISDVKGISIQKKFIETKADMEGVSLRSYLVVKPDDFAYVTVTSRNGEKITLAHNTTEDTYIVSSSYVVFSVVRKDILLPDYLFMYFNRPEFDRYSRFNSWGSARETFSWEEMCDIDFELPPIEIQRKYVEIYNGLVDNQIAYKTGLEDLKLVCDGFVENLKKTVSTKPIGQFIEELSEKNDGSITLAQGVDVNLQFIPAKREAEDKESGKIVHNGEFAFNKVVKCNGTKLPIALRKGPTCFISGSYTVFKVTDETKLIPEYLMLWMSREETQRKCGFNAWGSTRDVLPFEELCQLEIPYPDITVQQSIVDIYNAYILRKEINEQLKQQIKIICPVLIKGAVEEAKRS